MLEEILAIWWGTGANGKTTTARVLLKTLGDYVDRAAPNLLIDAKHDRHPTELADLAWKRLIFSIEVDQGRHLAESLIKDLTGGDRKKARFMRQDFFGFEQTFDIILIVNHRPIIAGGDVGIWRRVRLIPWTEQIPPTERRDQDELIGELAAEGAGILNWLMAGLRDRQNDRHWVAPEVVAANDEYRAEMDVLAGFIEDRCILKPTARVLVKDAYDAYVKWCEAAGEEPVSKRAFTDRVRDRGIAITRKGHGGQRVCRGLGLVTDGDASSIYSQKRIL